MLVTQAVEHQNKLIWPVGLADREQRRGGFPELIEKRNCVRNVEAAGNIFENETPTIRGQSLQEQQPGETRGDGRWRRGIVVFGDKIDFG